MPAGIVPRCYDAFRDPDASTFHLLLEDLGETHFIVTEWPLPPSMEQCERIIDVYDPRLGAEVGTVMDEVAIAQWLESYQRRFAAFADRLGDRLSPARRRIYERVFACLLRLLTR